MQAGSVAALLLLPASSDRSGDDSGHGQPSASAPVAGIAAALLPLLLQLPTDDSGAMRAAYAQQQKQAMRALTEGLIH